MLYTPNGIYTKGSLRFLKPGTSLIGVWDSLYHHLQFPSLRTFSWRSSFGEAYHWEFPSGDQTKDEMSALHFLIPRFSPIILAGRVHRVLCQPEELTDCLPPRMQTLHGCWLLSLSNRPDDRFCILPSIAEVVIRLPFQAFTSAGREMENKLASLLVSLFHLCDPYKRGRFSLQIMRRENDSMEKVHEACVSLKKDGYAFEICQ